MWAAAPEAPSTNRVIYNQIISSLLCEITRDHWFSYWRRDPETKTCLKSKVGGRHRGGVAVAGRPTAVGASPSVSGSGEAAGARPHAPQFVASCRNSRQPES